jgi:hypothetical protein
VIVQREIEGAGIPTVIVASLPTIAVQLGAPRVAASDTPLGAAFGAPGDADGQRQALLDALRLLERVREPGAVVPLDVSYRSPA